VDSGGRPQSTPVDGAADKLVLVDPTVLHAPDEPMAIQCPRCRAEADERFYGPCGRCRNQLRATLGGPRRDVDVEAYAPKMNVTPNAVALKE
jgi:hypothetical protein